MTIHNNQKRHPKKTSLSIVVHELAKAYHGGCRDRWNKEETYRIQMASTVHTVSVMDNCEAIGAAPPKHTPVCAQQRQEKLGNVIRIVQRNPSGNSLPAAKHPEFGLSSLANHTADKREKLLHPNKHYHLQVLLKLLETYRSQEKGFRVVPQQLVVKRNQVINLAMEVWTKCQCL